MNQPTEAGVKKAYDEGCDDVKRVIKTLFPDAFKKGHFTAGAIVCGGNTPNNLWTVIGYASNPAARAFYNSIGGNYHLREPDVLLVMNSMGAPTYKQDNGWWTLHKRVLRT